MKVLVYGDLSHGQLQVVWRCRDILRNEYGLELETGGFIKPGQDAILLVHSPVDSWPEWLDYRRSKLNVVVLERIDGPQLTGPVRRSLSHPNLKAVIKNTVYSDWRSYNEPFWRCHEPILRAMMNDRSRREEAKRPEPITQEMACKLKLGFSFAAYPHCDPLRNLNAGDLIQPRPYKLHFAGTVEYEGGDDIEWLRWHRRRAFEEVGRTPWQNINCAGRGYDFSEYFRTMRQSEFVVSPWGLGEPCYRDFEAAMSGCMVVKPDTQYILTVPTDFYRIPIFGRCMVKPDFSDLREVVEKCEPLDQNSRNVWADYIARHNSTASIAKRLAAILWGAVK